MAADQKHASEMWMSGKNRNETVIRYPTQGRIEGVGCVATSQCHTAWLCAHRIAIDVLPERFFPRGKFTADHVWRGHCLLKVSLKQVSCL